MSKQAESAKHTSRAFKNRTGTKSDTIYAHIFDAILEHRLTPGTKLSEEALGEIFGVSRTIIRRELLQLAHEGVVSIRPNRGAIVANPSVDEARQVLYARRLVERSITELVVQHATDKQIKEMRKMVLEEQKCFARGENGTGIRLSGEFHLKLAEFAGNGPFIGFQRSLVSQTSLIIAQYEKVTRSHCSFDEHNQLLDAISARDTNKAVALMMHHMDHIDEKLSFDNDGATDDLHAIFSHVGHAGNQSSAEH